MSGAEQLASPAALTVLTLFGLAFVRFGLWWLMLRPILAMLLRPSVLLVVAVAAAAAWRLG